MKQQAHIKPHTTSSTPFDNPQPHSPIFNKESRISKASKGCEMVQKPIGPILGDIARIPSGGGDAA